METRIFLGLAIKSILIVSSGDGCKLKSIESSECFAQTCTFKQRRNSLLTLLYH